ncbi:unnamed protein product [Rotaria sp. Silwood2]|nr:unnamed protein product [Rotaria sp. Silwood2]
MESDDVNQPLVSSWQVLLPTAKITSSLIPHLSCFPVTTYKLKDRSQLSSQAHCELLVDFMSNTIEYSQSLKAGRQVNEVRDVPTSHYVCRWWIQHFQDIKVYNDGDQPIQFKKKHRDQIRWNNAMTPFRRSGLWMTIKAVFQTILTKHLGPIGNIIYKLLITDFLTHVITKIHSEISTDVLVHCIRKTLRRVNKIETSLSSGDTGDWNKWIQHKKYTIQKTIQHIMPKSDWQDHIRISQKQSSNFLVDNFSLNDTDICKHSCSKLSSYLEALPTSRILSSSSNSNYRNELTDINLDDYIPSAQELRKRPNYTIGMVLTRIEIWIERDLERWMNRPSSGRNRFQALLFLFEDYQSDALSHYYPSSGSTDPIGYSRFILASLTIIRCMHEQLCKDPRFRRLEQHSIDIPNLMSLFQYLVLPNREDMTRARNLYDYFKMFLNKTYPDVLTRVDHTNAFGVYYASQSPEMNESIRKIRAQAEVDKKAKIQDVKDAKESYKRLMDSIQAVSCSCERVYGYRYHCITCSRCHTMNEANRIQVKIFESPLPSEDTDAYAVIFELQMPIEFRSYRDIVWQFINRPTPNRQHNMYEWLSVPPCNTKLAPYFTGPKDAKIKLISSRKSATQSHYSCPPSIATAPIETFLFECSLNVMISPTFPVEFDTECRILTPQLNHPDYKQLQFTIKNTGFLQNDVIAKLSQCPARLKPSQFVEFGSFRSGHLLQWWNLLALLEMDSLPISEESVAILVLHSILQYGPIAQDEHSSHRSWCSEAHQQLIEDNFTNELITRLDCRLDECERNWQNEMVLVVITVITMRILTICNSECEERTAALAIKCRKTSEKWIELISQSLQTMSSSDLNEMQILRSKMVTIGISCVLTFSTHANRIHLLLSSAEHGLSLLKAVTTIHDNIILSKDQSNITVFLSNMIRYSEHVLVTIQPRIAKLLREASFQLLNNFVSIHWAVIRKKGRMNANWQKRSTDVYDGWYDCDYESRSLSLNCVKGTFLVDGMTVGFLPENITNNSLFRRVFGNHIFEVQLAESSQTYITKHFYHGDRRVQYEFCWNDRTRQLTIIEQHTKTNKTFHMISPNLFDTELADRFVNDFSHWLIQERRTIEFRPLHFNHPDFLNYAPYELSLATGYIDTIGDIQPKKLVNQSSQLFQTLFSRYFVRLDDKPYVYMMYESDSQFNRVFHIYLTRLGIAFKYDAATKILTSREYADMYVDQDQWLGTLTGLQSGLLLSPLPGDHYCLEHYPYKKLIVSFGTVKSNWNSSEHHQTVKIDRSGSISHPNKYFTFLLNDRLKVLQSTDSPTGWLYLALLHALTSHALPDEYTGMTGMERAFQLLYSAGCQSDQPYDDLSLEIICTIASISPKVDYYPQHLTCMI